MEEDPSKISIRDSRDSRCRLQESELTCFSRILGPCTEQCPRNLHELRVVCHIQSTFGVSSDFLGLQPTLDQSWLSFDDLQTRTCFQARQTKKNLRLWTRWELTFISRWMMLIWCSFWILWHTLWNVYLAKGIDMRPKERQCSHTSNLWSCISVTKNKLLISLNVFKSRTAGRNSPV